MTKLNTPQRLSPIARAAQRLAGSAHSAAPPQTASLGLDALAADLKRRFARKALLGAGASLIPIPLIDWAVDAALLVSILSDINTAFGLTPAQLQRLDSGSRERTFAAIQFVGNRLIGTFITRTLVASLVKGAGVKLTAQQLSKAVPIAGQLASAALNYGTLRYLINKHIDDCVRVLAHHQPQSAAHA